MTDDTDKAQMALKRQLADLRLEHSELDATVAKMTADSAADKLQLQRIKKRKLAIKDEIRAIQTRLLPDIIA